MEGSKEYYLKLKEQEFDEIFRDLTEPATYQQGNKIEQLLNTSTISEGQEREIHSNLYRNAYDIAEAEAVIDFLYHNQRDDVSGGFNYQANDIQKKLKNE